MTNETNGQAIITAIQLEQKHACDEQLEHFGKVWGERVDVEEEEFRKHASEFEWYWAADHLLPRHPAVYRDTDDSWYGVWADRWKDATESFEESFQKLKAERREKANEADRLGKYDEVYDSFNEAIGAALKARDGARSEWQAVWFARLYREACGITNDPWQLKEKEDEAGKTSTAAEGVTDADAASATEAATDGEEGIGLDSSPRSEDDADDASPTGTGGSALEPDLHETAR